MTLLTSSEKRRQTRNRKLVRLTAAVLLVMMLLSCALPANAANFSISNSTLSTTDVAADGKIVMNISATGQGVVNAYSYQYAKDGSNSWKNIAPYEWITQSTYTFYPNKFSDVMSDTNSRWKIRLRGKDTSGTTASKTFYITVGEPKIEISTFTAPDLTIGNTITLKTTLSNTISGFTYQYKYTYIDKNGTERVITDFQSKSSYNWTASSSLIPENANCTLKVYVKEKNNKAKQVVKTTTIKTTKPTYPDVNISSFTKSGGDYVGDKITLKTAVSSGTSPYQYQYSYDDNSGTKHIISNYTANKTSVSWDTSKMSAGSYTVRVEVKDSKNKTASKTTTVTLKAKPDVTISSFTKSGGDYVGDKQTLETTVSSGTSPYQYKYTYTDSNGTAHTIADYADNKKSITWDTSKLSAGTYTVKVEVKDSNGKTGSKTTTVTLKSRSVEASVKTLEQSYTQNDAWYPNVRFEVSINTDKSTAPSPFTYKVQYKKSSDKDYKDISDFKSYDGSSKVETLSTSNDVATYNYRLIVKDKNGTEYTINGSTFEIKYNPIKFTFNASPKDFTSGGTSDGGENQKSTLSVTNVTGGNGDDLQYKFEYTKYGELTDTNPELDAANATWTALKDWSEESTADFIIENKDDAGVYAVRVSVQNKDNSDSSKIVTKTIKGMRVKKPVEITISDINSLIDKVDTWMNNSLTDTQKRIMQNWENMDSKDGNSILDLYDYRYSTFQVAYDTAKDASNHDKNEYWNIYHTLDEEFTKMKNFVKSKEFQDITEATAGEDNAWTPISTCNFVFKMFTTYLGAVIDCFKSLAGDTSVSTTIFSGFDYHQAAADLYPIAQTIAYSLIILLVGVNAIESALEYEMFTMRGAVKIFARLLFAKIFVDLSLDICKGIVSLSTSWLNGILNVTKGIVDNLSISLTGPDASGLWIVGWLVDFFNQIGFLIIIGPVFLLLSLTVLMVFCKLFIRCFEIAMLECVAPVFFACLCGSATKEYFKKFIISFLSVVLDVVFTGIIFYIYSKYLEGAFTDVDMTNLSDMMELEGGFLSFALVSMGAFILMIKTPRVLKNLVS